MDIIAIERYCAKLGEARYECGRLRRRGKDVAMSDGF